jgi:deazaflavin-dependent oxidoreductase (nitroreductase family)
MPGTSDWNRKTIEEFRANRGKVAAFKHQPLLLLHHKGAKSGKERINPLAYQQLDDGSFAVFGSKGGSPKNPDWFYNIVANPRVTVEVGTQTVDAVARVPSRVERDRIWEKQKELNRAFADYEQKTSRTIPVVILEPMTVVRSA